MTDSARMAFCFMTLVVTGCGGGGGGGGAPEEEAPTPVACYVAPAEGTLRGELEAFGFAAHSDQLTFEIRRKPERGEILLDAPGSSHFSYTRSPGAGYGEDSFEFSIEDDSGARRVARARIVPTARIMPLGDSITSGIMDVGFPEPSHRTGYRLPLFNALTDGGYPLDMVGSLVHGDALPFDADHEGHGGWRDDEIAWGQTADAGDDGAYAWLNLNPADFVLLHIGTNGLDGNADDVQSVLDEIERWESDTGNHVTVLLARIIDTYPRDAEGLVEQFNDNLESVARTRIADPTFQDDIVLVDQQRALWNEQGEPDGSLYYSAQHPNEAGYQVMADTWSRALERLLLKCP